MNKLMKGILAAGAVVAMGVGASPANAYALTETSWSTSGLKSVVVETGAYSWSIDGLGTGGGTGNIQVNKPATATSVYKAYFMAAQVRDGSKPTLGSPSAVLLNAQAVTFDLESLDGGWGTEFNNYFADVTSLVSSTLNSASTGITDIAVNEGGLSIEGTGLVVVWNDSSVDVATLVLAFGNSNPAGDTFTLDFPALTAPQLEDLQMSIGDSYSYQEQNETFDNTGTQKSDITVNGQLLTNVAGGFDDCYVIDDSVDPPVNETTDPTLHWGCQDNALFTIGGVGDSLINPTAPFVGDMGDQPDDELYSLSPFVQVGSSNIVVTTSNPTNDDNVFFAAFNLKHIIATVSASGDSGSPELPNTGTDATASAIAAAAAVVAGLLGAMAVLARRRRA